ncbi:NAD(P)H-hydrate dehydratase [candidate division WOR-3 bacterium]|uniref:Bifunctional NAD(P)H-hydrate repair enzyme n=1 Tax=candidate division WOR-3 bacterium TaxID=2052148 RepID=A0A9D5K7V9_UNCW3|nr:NAD(P)H-hydrate dehydratase [candidate division WOR-3 bacterium]MBD3363725.1 NAD(P)H-hydrate dehydratase [candidate division WOR-3 bacterium]
MRLVRKAEMRDVDARAISEFSIPSLLLMENAGRGVAETIEEYFTPENLSVLVICGKGNNGGDGFVVARHLANSGAEVEIILLSKISELKGDAETNAKIARKSGIPIDEVTTEDDLACWKASISDFEVICDGIFGTGFKGSPKGLAKSAIELVNSASSFIVSIDIPSGIEADGCEPECAVSADLTVTMAYLKPSHLLYPARDYCGDIWVADIGIPNPLIDAEGRLRLMTAEDACLLIPERVPWGNKSTFGKVLILAGSKGMSGAARLACEAALRTGAGLTYLGFPETLSEVLDTSLLETVKRPLPDTGDGHLGLQAFADISKIADEVKLLAMGPGLGTHPETVALVKKLLVEWKKPMIADADAINAIATEPGLLEGKKPPIILTPHPGEMARLIEGKAHEIDINRLDVAEEYARKWSSVLVLKGAPTITACPDEVWVNSTGNSGLSSGGTGDVLTGTIAGLAAQGLPLTQAARLGVWLHGRAGDLSADELGEHSVVAGDLLYYLPEAMLSACEEREEETD